MDVKGLIKKRASHKAKLTLFQNYLETVESCAVLSGLQTNELNARLSKIEELYSDYDCIQSDIENSCEIPDEQFKEREAFETQYFSVLARARELLAPAPARGAGDCGSSVTGSCCTAREELQKRQKWRTQKGQLQLGEMVLVRDDRLPPSRWLLGRVTRLHPGSDGVTRVADVLTTSGTLRRAFNRLCPLPVMDQNVVPGAAAC
ncbi:uncharacterized protein [Choristoneura fumiferana]|uniref:uncharacterized protein n=1 Tax=Choristoneura fumiferana TaxID=7141 RepID=UPI003D158C88